MYSNVYNDEGFTKVRRLIENKEFKKAYNFLHTINNKCSEWYYLRGVSAMNIGYYEEGEDCLKTFPSRSGLTMLRHLHPKVI